MSSTNLDKSTVINHLLDPKDIVLLALLILQLYLLLGHDKRWNHGLDQIVEEFLLNLDIALADVHDLVTHLDQVHPQIGRQLLRRLHASDRIIGTKKDLMLQDLLEDLPQQERRGRVD